ncbi:Pyrophosphate-energized vacuolar membrane proton pump [Hondaea fermentalgiana]|uniref:H(+)-exporting diphosphatase n=1 Tax=Hondaea fermentalgiana TaxID=2315210 RepID=A0A2R5G967_9STRA|nr:Pyrophosphate-energized vacuolar membrane proton pump [Hondaea fermentalgiana]|eukprot:GBG27602.1 Pyrophosphate-energized vacuolar membrane proton pump [Hondaea fermentalgiana]
MIEAASITDNAGAEATAIVLIVASSIIGLVFAGLQYYKIKSIDMTLNQTEESLVNYDDQPSGGETHQEKLKNISEAIQLGARSFLKAEYSICAVFLAVFGIILLVLLGTADNCGPVPVSTGVPQSGDCWADAGFTLLAFLIGGVTSMVCGLVGMLIAVYTNVRCTVEATRGWTGAFNAAFRGGAVMGFCLSSLGLLVLYIVIEVYRIYFVSGHGEETTEVDGEQQPVFIYLIFFEVVAGYGLGGSSIALFGRVGGGIYTKAADVGADLVGKVEKNIPEDDPRNPATIADNVGDNVGDIAGMGADLFGSFAESTSAALVLSATSTQLQESYATMLFPLVISAMGILACILTSFVATNIRPVRDGAQVETVLKTQLVLSTIILTPLLALVSWFFLPADFTFGADPNANSIQGTAEVSHWWGAFICLACGLWAGLFTGLITEYYTSYSYSPVKEVAASSETGAATVIIYGLALGYKSAIIPVFLFALTIFASFYLCGLYGVSLAALGMLSSFSIGLTIDGYGPITDNAGGLAEMAELGENVRHITDTLDAAGNTTAAIGKGFAIGSAALVSLALFGAYVSRIGALEEGINILSPITFAFLLIGAMVPYWFSAMTMKSVGIAAQAMVMEVREQFNTIEGIMEGTAKPDYARCVEISTRASLREMIAPSALVILAPILTGYLFGVFALAGYLAGSLVSAVQLAISASNTGGAWDNSKKFIEQGNFNGKGSENHKAAVVGDTVGDPLKDTSGPALNIVMKLQAIISLVFAASFSRFALPDGQAWAGYPQN